MTAITCYAENPYSADTKTSVSFCVPVWTSNNFEKNCVKKKSTWKVNEWKSLVAVFQYKALLILVIINCSFTKKYVHKNCAYFDKVKIYYTWAENFIGNMNDNRKLPSNHDKQYVHKFYDKILQAFPFVSLAHCFNTHSFDDLFFLLIFSLFEEKKTRNKNNIKPNITENKYFKTKHHLQLKNIAIIRNNQYTKMK